MKDDLHDDDLDLLVARALVERGELVPTTIEEVLESSVEEAIELPASLAQLRRTPSPSPLREEPRPARVTVVRALPYVALAAAAAAAIVFVATRRAEEIGGERPPASVTPSATEAAPTPVHITVSAPTCEASCCAGSACASPKRGFATCPTERTCVPCQGADDRDRRYRVRLGDVESLAKHVGGDLDLCVSVGAHAPWSCEPARLPGAKRPHGRFLATASTVEELNAGISIELRPHGGTNALAGWRSGIQVSTAALCQGLSVTLRSDTQERIGVLSLFLERGYYVELARRADVDALDALPFSVDFEGNAPRHLVAPDAAPSARFVLALGPFDAPDADALAEQLRADPRLASLRDGIRVDVGDGYDDHGHW